MPSHDAYAEPEGNRTFTVVLLALLILAVIGALFGFVLGRRAGKDIDDPQSRSGDGKSASPSASARNQGAPKPVNCPDFIQQGIKGQDGRASTPVTLVLYIRTAGSEVWICREADGSGLWYQGHLKSKNFYEDGEIPKAGVNGLLLKDAVQLGPDTYRAINADTTYLVTRQALKVSGGQNFEEGVVKVEP